MIALVAIVGIVLALIVFVVAGPLAALIPLLAGGILAIRLGYRNQAAAIAAATRTERPSGLHPPGPPTTEDRLAAVRSLHDAGLISDAEAEERRAAILREL